MKRKIQIVALLFFAVVIHVSAQIIAGSGAAGQLISNPNVNLTETVIGNTATGLFDLDCDSVPDMRVELHKGATVVDGANTVYLFVLNPAFQICADTSSIYLNTAAYYTVADTLNCSGSHDWGTDSIYQLGNYGCMDCSGPASIINKYIAYRNTLTSQAGWIRISFYLPDGGSSSAAITLSIPEILSPCANTACAFPSGGGGTGTCGVFTFNYTITAPVCAGTCDGSIAITGVTGGVPGYYYLWNDPGLQTTSTATNLCSGVYCINLNDNAGNSCSTCFSIPNPPAITYTFTTTNVTCHGVCDGSVCLAGLSGGAAPYTYIWVPGGQTTACMNAACAGTYSVCITDANGCTVCQTVTITEPSALAVAETVSDESCNGCCDGAAHAVVTGGTPGYVFDWGPGTPAGDGTGTISYLCSGSYSYCITDANGCSLCDSVLVSFPLGINDPEAGMELSVFPNPSTGVFEIGLPLNETVEVELFNSMGEKVYVAEVKGTSKISSGLANGIYILKVNEKQSGRMSYKKIIISE